MRGVIRSILRIQWYQFCGLPRRYLFFLLLLLRFPNQQQLLIFILQQLHNRN